MTNIVTQNGVVVTSAHNIYVSHNDYRNKDKSNFGQFFVAIERPNASAYDAQYDPILFMPKNCYTPGTDVHKRRNEELEAMANIIADAFKEKIRTAA